MKLRRQIAALSALALLAPLAWAEVSNLTNAAFVFNGQQKIITQRAQPDASLAAAFYALPLDCDGICLAPNTAADGVTTISDIDTIAFMTGPVADGTGLIIDSRMPEHRAAGYLPTSVSVPFALIDPANPLLTDILVALGARAMAGTLNFADAMDLVVYDAGPTTMDASVFINALIAAGYPAAKINYFRGGMQVRNAVGLNTEGTSS